MLRDCFALHETTKRFKKDEKLSGLHLAALWWHTSDAAHVELAAQSRIGLTSQACRPDRKRETGSHEQKGKNQFSLTQCGRLS